MDIFDIFFGSQRYSLKILMNNTHLPYFSLWSEKPVCQTDRVSRIEELWSTHLATSCQSEFFSKISIWWLTTRWTSSTGTWLTPRASRTPLPNIQTCLCWAPTLLPILIRLTTWRKWWTTRDWEESEQFPNLIPQVILELGAMRSQLYFRKPQRLQEEKNIFQPMLQYKRSNQPVAEYHRCVARSKLRHSQQLLHSI